MCFTMKYKKIDARAKEPTKGSEYAAGLDLYALIDQGTISIQPHTTAKIGTGIAVEIPADCFGGIFARSGIATKRGLRPSNCTGVIDSDYRGEIIVALHNDTDECQTVMDGERIAQMIVIPFLGVELCEVDELEDTERGDGGFGSTGIQ